MIPKQRSRKSPITLDKYKYENKRLKIKPEQNKQQTLY